MSDHWHYAVSSTSEADPSVIETVVARETDLTKAAAKRALQPQVRAAQGRVRYPHPTTGRIIEPADWWIESDELEWIGPFPEGPIHLFAVYACDGDCAASAVRHRDDVAAHLAEAGLDVTVEPVHRLN